MQLAAQEKWEQALQFATQARDVQQTRLGAEQPEMFGILESIAVWQDRSGDYRAAADTWQQLHDLSAKVRGEKHWSTVSAGLFGEACAKAAQFKSEDQQRLATASQLSFHADQAMSAGKYAEASDFARKSFDIRSALLGLDSVVTAVSSHTLGTALLALGDCQTARPLLEQCEITREKLIRFEEPRHVGDADQSGGNLRQT